MRFAIKKRTTLRLVNEPKFLKTESLITQQLSGFMHDDPIGTLPKRNILLPVTGESILNNGCLLGSVCFYITSFSAPLYHSNRPSIVSPHRHPKMNCSFTPSKAPRMRLPLRPIRSSQFSKIEHLRSRCWV